MDDELRKLGVPGIESIIAGFLTIVTTPILFRKRYKAANIQIKAAGVQDQILRHVQERSNRSTSDQNVRRTSVKMKTLENETAKVKKRLSEMKEQKETLNSKAALTAMHSTGGWLLAKCVGLCFSPTSAVSGFDFAWIGPEGAAFEAVSEARRANYTSCFG